jgi:hypothetical protein
MDFEYSSGEELLELIRTINGKYYECLNANILLLEELTDTNYLAYLIEQRDAYSHLVRVFDCDILSPEGKENVRTHLYDYVNHLQNGILDTFRKILEFQFKSIRSYVPRNEVTAIEYQIANWAHSLRIMSNENPVDQRIDGYKKLLGDIDEIRKRFSPGT